MHKCFELITERWDQPFVQPIVFDKETHDMKAESWAVKVYNLTGSGRISKKGSSHLFLNFCPVCGEQLREIKERDVTETTDG